MTPMSNQAIASSCYLNNAQKIAPFTIIPPPMPTSLPSSSNHDDHEKQVKDFESQVKEMIQTILPSFLEEQQGSTNNSNQIKIQPLEGGLSNHLFTVTNQTTQSTILIRIHPTNTSSSNPSIELINRKHENQIASFVSKYNIGPKFYGRFDNGRIEEYYTNVKTLRYDEMSIPYYAMGIAEQMSMLHSLDVNEIQSKCYNDDIDHDINHHYFDSYDGDIWSRINKWLHMSKQLLATNNDSRNQRSITNDNLLKLHSIVQTIEHEWKWYQQEMMNNSSREEKDYCSSHIDQSIQQKAIKFCREIVFTHMDCQSLNILTPISSMSSLSECQSILSFNNDDHPEMEESSDNSSITSNLSHHNPESTTIDEMKTNKAATIHIIDYEYASFNRRVIDIANTFLEHCDMNNLKPNYELEYPSKEEQYLFLSCYLRQCGKNDSSLFWLRDLFVEEEGMVRSTRQCCKTEKDEFLDVVQSEVTKHTLFSHLEWSCWSIIQSIQCSIDFDYVKYAEIRMKGYFYFKNLCWN